MGDLRRMAGALRCVGLQPVIAAIACWALILGCAGPSQAQGWQTARKPQGLYAHVELPSLINGYFKKYYKNHSLGTYEPTCPPQAPVGAGKDFFAKLHSDLQGIYRDVLANSAVSGIVAGVPWCLLDHGDGIYDWSWLEDVFGEAATANKNVQLHITPGVDSPSWLTSNPSQSCDPVITAAAPLLAYQDCAWVTFKTLPETMVYHYGYKLPLPWSPVYTSAWNSFLQALNTQYGQNPLFIAIAVAGPVSVSSEMILPTTANKSTFPTALDVNTGWECIIETSFPQATDNCSQISYSAPFDQAFIDAWKQTILSYENIFSGVTLILITDDGGNMPEIGVVPPGDPTYLVGTNCSNAPENESISCDAKATVVSTFIGVGGPNEKATAIGGLEASNPTATGYIDLPGVKLLTSMTLPPQSPPFLGGAQFDYAVSTNQTLRNKEGCLPSECPPSSNLTAEQAAYNLLGNFFYGTIAAGHYGQPTFAPPYVSPLHFLVMDYNDILYAKPGSCMQQLITQASNDLLATAGKSPLGPSELDNCP